MHTPLDSNPSGLKYPHPPPLNHPPKEWIRSLTIFWSMHSLVHSHCSTRPTYCQVTHRCRYTVGLLCTLLPPSVLELALNQGPFVTPSRDACYKAHTAVSLAKTVDLNQFAGCLQQCIPILDMARFFQTQCSLDHNVSRWQVST